VAPAQAERSLEYFRWGGSSEVGATPQLFSTIDRDRPGVAPSHNDRILQLMGLDAVVIAVGAFSQDVIGAMEYHPDYYASVEEGQIVLVHVFLACTSDVSHALAKAFGVGAMELGKHHLNPHAARVDDLIELFGEEDVEQFILLRDRGFNFYYAPNA
jgi:hypothetical protein